MLAATPATATRAMDTPAQTATPAATSTATSRRGRAGSPTVVQARPRPHPGEIDPVFYEKTYYVGSREDKNAFELLYQALRKTKRAGIGRFSFHDREYLVALRAGDDALLLHALRFHDEVVSGQELEVERGPKPSNKEIDMAGRLVSSLSERFNPSAYEDTYRDAVLDLIKRKAKGEEI